MAIITINGISIDPSAPKIKLAALALNNKTAEHSDYILVQPEHPLNRRERDALSEAGAQILEAVPGALVCSFPTTDLSAVRKLPFVKWADVYPNVVKIAPSLLQLPAQAGGVLAEAAAMAKPPALDATAVTIDVVLHQNAQPAAAAAAIAEAAHVPVGETQVLDGKIRLTIKRRRLAEVANVDLVRHFEEVSPRKLANTVARSILRIDGADMVPQVDFTGKGEVVCVADTGFDRGSETNTHPAFKGRVKKLYGLARTKADDPHGHGTHVAGSVLGNGVSTSIGPVRGAAPEATLVFQSAYASPANALGGLPDKMEDLFLPVYRDDAVRIHTNSWGTPGNLGRYDSQARALDQFIYTHRDMLVCFSAGNEGRDSDANGQIDPGSVTPPGTAKNCLTVGASENYRPGMTLTYGDAFEYLANPIKTDRLADNPDGIVAFSGRGPTLDNRIKPDVVAPGSFILSTRSRISQSEGWGLTEDPLYMYEGGTSMSTPLVAGCAALVREFLRVKWNTLNPSAALMKALIINGAAPLPGQYVPSEAGASPSNSQGFGRVDVCSVVGPYRPNESVFFQDEGRALDTGEEQRFPIVLPAGVKSVKVTLVWTDPPGEGLQSDLDLVVRMGGEERHGNVGPAAGGFDRANNVEQVTWKDLPAGELEVAVLAHSIAISEQTFALVVRIF